MLLLVNTHALLPVGGDGARTRVVTGAADASAMLIEERCCTAQAVDPHRYRRLPALEVLRVRALHALHAWRCNAAPHHVHQCCLQSRRACLRRHVLGSHERAYGNTCDVAPTCRHSGGRSAP